MNSPMLRRLRSEFRRLADPVRARGQQAYVKSAMPFHGVTTPQLRAVCLAVFKDVAWPSAAAWRAQVLRIWREAEYREERHAAIELSGHRAAREFQTAAALPMYERIVVEGAWWDYVDAVATQRFADLLRRDPARVKRVLLRWASGADIWKRRAAILSQIKMKRETDLGFLYACIEPSLGAREFFLRKAIGWALRQHAWTDPQEVLRYVRANQARISPLSRREALKNLKA